MNLTLTVTASAAVLARILATLPNDGGQATVTPGVASERGPESIQPGHLTINDDDDTTGDAPAVAGQLDKDGLPHDERIHSETPTLTGKGLWRKRRGVDNATIAQVEGELRARLAGAQTVPAPTPQPAPAAVTPVQPMPVPTPPAAPQPAPMPMPVPEPVAPQPMPVPTPPAAPQPAPQPTPVAQPTAIDFGSFMSALTQKMGSQIVTQDHLTAYCAELTQAFQVQVNSITDIAPRPDMVTYAVQLLQRDGRW